MGFCWYVGREDQLKMLSLDPDTLIFNSCWIGNNPERSNNNASFYFLYIHQSVKEWLSERTDLLKRQQLEKDTKRERNSYFILFSRIGSFLTLGAYRKQLEKVAEVCWDSICVVHTNPLHSKCVLLDLTAMPNIL